MLNPLTAEEQETLQRRFSEVPLELRKQFNEIYPAWEATWDEPLVATSSNPVDRTRSKQFLNLIALGPQVVPLLMDKLTNPDQFFALQAVNYLARTEIIVEFDLEDETALAGEQVRAIETIRRWLSLEG